MYPDDELNEDVVMTEGETIIPDSEDDQTPIETEDTTEQKTAEESVPSEDGALPAEGEDKEEKSNTQKRIDKLVADGYSLKDALAKKDDENAELKRQLEAKEAGDKLGNKPTEDDFDTIAEFAEALTDWKIAKNKIETEETYQKQSAEAEKKRISDRFQQKLNEGAENLKDFKKIGYFPEYLQEELLSPTLENPQDIIYRLGQEGELESKIWNMSARERQTFLGQLDAKISFEKNKPKPKPKLTDAPEPITPIGSADTISADDPIGTDEKSMDLYVKKRTADRVKAGHVRP